MNGFVTRKLIAGVACCVTTAAWAGPDWVEDDHGDAGSLPGSAQITNDSNSPVLTRVSGRLGAYRRWSRGRPVGPERIVHGGTLAREPSAKEALSLPDRAEPEGAFGQVGRPFCPVVIIRRVIRPRVRQSAGP